MIEKCHFIGIGGIGMSGLAAILLDKKIAVSGSDIASSTITEGLKKRGAVISLGHASHNIKPGMIVVVSSDIKESNPELIQALALKCPVLHRSDFLTQLMKGYKPLTVTGTHGKTTTTSLLAWSVMQAGLDPAFAVGGVLPELQTNARNGKGHYFIAEADESDGSFLKYPSYGAIVTNINLDHMEYYKEEKALIKAFRQFIENVQCPDALFWCGDDGRLEEIHPKGFSYGFKPTCQLRGSNFRQEGWSIHFDITFKGKSYNNIIVPLTGRHNALNAMAVFGLALNLGIQEADIKKGFSTFSGVARRCEKKGEHNSILIIDDYAHHPAEINATLKAIRQATPGKRLVAAFQPHRFTRTRDCLGTYGSIFDAADLVVVTDIYGAGETPIPGLSCHNILSELKQVSAIPCEYIPRGELANELFKMLRPKDVLVTLGAGDITHVGSQLLERFVD